MIDGTARLYPAVMTAADDRSLVHQDGANRNAAFGETLLGLLDGRFEIGIFRHWPGDRFPSDIFLTCAGFLFSLPHERFVDRWGIAVLRAGVLLPRCC